jgi:hypothetical protein
MKSKIDVEYLGPREKYPNQKEYVLRGNEKELGLRIAGQGVEGKFNMVTVNWGEGWKTKLEGSEKVLPY